MKDFGDHHKKNALDPESVREPLNYLKMDGHNHLCISCSRRRNEDYEWRQWGKLKSCSHPLPWEHKERWPLPPSRFKFQETVPATLKD